MSPKVTRIIFVVISFISYELSSSCLTPFIFTYVRRVKFNPFDISFFFGGFDMGGGGAQRAPSGKHTSDTFMRSNDLVTNNSMI